MRVLVELSGGAPASGLLEEALDLAARLEAELCGVFVEDPALLRSSGLPFVRQVHGHSGVAEALDPARVERELRVQAARAREELERLAEGRSLRWSFRTAQGQALRELAREAGAADVVVLRRDWRSAGGARLLSAAGRGELGLRAGSVLHARGPRRPRSPVAVLLPAQGQDRAVLRTAIRLAGSDRPLVVLACERPIATLARIVDESLAARERPVQLRTLPDNGTAALEQVLREVHAGMLVLHALDPLLDDPELDRRLESLRLPLLVWERLGEGDQ